MCSTASKSAADLLPTAARPLEARRMGLCLAPHVLLQCAPVSAGSPLGTWKSSRELPVVYDPVQTEVQGAKVFAPPHDLHHGFIIQLSDMTQVQARKVSQLKTQTKWKIKTKSQVNSQNDTVIHHTAAPLYKNECAWDTLAFKLNIKYFRENPK